MRLKFITYFAAVTGVAALLHAAEPVPVAQLQVEIAVPDEAGKQSYRVAPEAIQQMEEDGQTWLRISLPDPAPLKPWCQHAGLIATLKQPIPAAAQFVVSGRARSVSGAKGLSILRRWGGSEPWQHVELTNEWMPFSVERTAKEFETEWITLSLVAMPKRRLQPCAEGVFDIADLRIEILEPAAE